MSSLGLLRVNPEAFVNEPGDTPGTRFYPNHTMIANASFTKNIGETFLYARAVNAPEKGGRIVFSNRLEVNMPLEVQLAMMVGFASEKYETEAYTIVLSHSKEDKEYLQKLQQEDPELVDKYVEKFLNELQNKGIDLMNTPFVVTEHLNTDCLHYHLIICATKFDNSRLDTGYIGKKAAMAAAAVSKKYGLHYANNLDFREEAFVSFSKKKQTSPSSSTPYKRKRRTKEQIAEDAARKKKKNEELKEKEKAEKINRKERLLLAEERKKWLKEIVEISFKNSKTKQEFRSLLSEKEIGVSKVSGKGWCVLFTEGEKTRIYPFQKLKIDETTISDIETMLNGSSNIELPLPQISFPSDGIIEGIKEVFPYASNWLDLSPTGVTDSSGGIGGGGPKNISKKKKKKDEEEKEGRGHGR